MPVRSVLILCCEHQLLSSLGENLVMWPSRHHGNTYLTSLPLVSVRRHGQCNSAKVEMKFCRHAPVGRAAEDEPPIKLEAADDSCGWTSARHRSARSLGSRLLSSRELTHWPFHCNDVKKLVAPAPMKNFGGKFRERSEEWLGNLAILSLRSQQPRSACERLRAFNGFRLNSPSCAGISRIHFHVLKLHIRIERSCDPLTLNGWREPVSYGLRDHCEVNCPRLSDGRKKIAGGGVETGAGARGIGEEGRGRESVSPSLAQFTFHGGFPLPETG